MTSRLRAALIALVLCVPLLAVAIYLMESSGEEPKADRELTSKTELAEGAQPAASDEELEAEARERSERVEQRIEVEQTEGIAAAEETSAEGPSDLAEQVIAEAEPAARRFYAAFSLYEIGESTPAIERTLRQTTTVAFAQQLLETDPVRIPPGTKPPERAELGSLGVRIPPGEEDPNAIVLVGETLRGGEREVLGLEMIFTDPRYGWRVAGLGR